MTKVYKKQNGFTLIELLIALVILAIGLLAIGGMQIISIKGNHFSSNVTRATILAQNKLEYLKTLSYDDPNLVAGRPPEEITESGIVFTVQYDVMVLGNWMKKIVATARWIDRVDHSISLSTIKSK